MATSDHDRADERSWDGGWELSRHARLLRAASLPLSAKLDWLEQAQKLAKQLRVAQVRTQANVAPN